MNLYDDHIPQRGFPHDDPFAASDPAGRLDGDDVEAPDLTERIMDRLGYVRIDAPTARRMRRRKMMSRAMVACMMLGAAAFGVYLHSISERARRPVDHPIPRAVTNDLHEVESGVRRMREMIAPRGTNIPYAPQRDRSDDREPSQSCVQWAGLL